MIELSIKKILLIIFNIFNSIYNLNNDLYEKMTKIHTKNNF